MFKEEFLFPFLQKSFCLNTRVHPLNSYISSGNAEVFIKREDELSSGISGSKYRKFASLIKFFKTQNFEEIGIIGSSSSNNVSGILQLLNENNIAARLFLLENHHAQLAGNSLWIRILHGKTPVQIARKDWPDVEKIAAEIMAEKAAKTFILPEGGAVKEALPGAMTLAFDILKNEEENNTFFEHIFIDSGSGMSATGLILGLQYLGCKKQIYITLIAGDEIFFLQRLKQLTEEAELYFGIKLPDSRPVITFLKPVSAASFGALNNTILEETVKIAREEGILMEPLYSVKHFYTAKKFIETNNLQGNILCIYNGGSFGLTGFQKKLSAFIQNH